MTVSKYNRSTSFAATDGRGRFFKLVTGAKQENIIERTVLLLLMAREQQVILVTGAKQVNVIEGAALLLLLGGEQQVIRNGDRDEIREYNRGNRFAATNVRLIKLVTGAK